MRGEYNSALQAASAEGHVTVVKLLPSKGADINVHRSGQIYPSALSAAAIWPSKEAICLLIDEGIDSSYYTEAVELAAAASQVVLDQRDEPGWFAVVKLLREKGAQFTAKAFQAACADGHESMVQLMVNEGVDFTPDLSIYKTALEKAIKGEETILEMRGQEVAFQRGYKAVMKLLREHISGLSR